MTLIACRSPRRSRKNSLSLFLSPPPVQNEFHILNPAAQLERGGNHRSHQMANLIPIGESKNDRRLPGSLPLVNVVVGITLHSLIACEFSEAGREECRRPHSVVFFGGQSPIGSLPPFGGLNFFSTIFGVDLFNLNS